MQKIYDKQNINILNKYRISMSDYPSYLKL